MAIFYIKIFYKIANKKLNLLVYTTDACILVSETASFHIAT